MQGEVQEAYGMAGNPSGVGGKERGCEACQVSENLWGTAREWEGGSSCCRASTPPEWKNFPGGTKSP